MSGCKWLKILWMKFWFFLSESGWSGWKDGQDLIASYPFAMTEKWWVALRLTHPTKLYCAMINQ